MVSDGSGKSLASVVRRRNMDNSCGIPNSVCGLGNVVPNGSVKSLANVVRHRIMDISCDIPDSVSVVSEGSVQSLANVVQRCIMDNSWHLWPHRTPARPKGRAPRRGH